jgi:Ca2+-binding EF-hand superfamily protein
MTAEELKEKITAEGMDLIKQMILVLDTLQGMNSESFQRILAMSKIARPLLPKDMLKVLDAFDADVTLTISFIEMAKKYNRMDRETMKQGLRMLGKGGVLDE